MKPNKNKTHTKQFYAYLEGWLSIVINLALFGLKFWAGVVTGSVALVADAWHTLSDSFSSIIVLVSTKIASKPADNEHPYGHGRAETIATLLIGVFLILIAVNFGIEAVKKFLSHEAAEFGTLAIVATVVSIVAKEGMAQFAIWAGKKTNSDPLIADGWHHRTDAISSALILAGIFAGPYFWWIDAVMGFGVAILIAYTGLKISGRASSRILGEKPDDKTIQKIEHAARKVVDRHIALHKIRIHHYGNHIEMSAHIKLPGEKTLSEAHAIATKIEAQIHADLEIVATIHMEPIQ